MRVSVIVPCFNQGQYLDEALRSVLNQTYNDWDCFIVNDGSSDDTHEIANNWINKNDKFKYIKTENSGVNYARNLGVKASNASLILPLDADDKIGKDYIEKAVKRFKDNPKLKLVYCKAEKFGDVNGPWTLPDFSLKALAIDNMIFCSALYKKEDWERVGGYDVHMDLGLEDYEFWIALLKDGGEVERLESIGFFYRIKNVSRQNKLNATDKEQLFKYLSFKHTDFFIEQLGSFHNIHRQCLKAESESYKSIKNKKLAIDIAFKTCFGFTIFNKLK